MNRLRKSKAGFTLVELLVVMAIIAILTAIVVPNVVKYIRKGRVTRAQAEVKSIELALVKMLTDADRSNPSEFFNPAGVKLFLDNWGDPYTAGIERMKAAKYLYTRTFYALLREGRAALSDPYNPAATDPDAQYGIITFYALDTDGKNVGVLNADVVKRLGTSYLADLRTDPWGNMYQIYPGPWPSRKTPVQGSAAIANENMFRIYMAGETDKSLPGSKGSGRPDSLTLTIEDPEVTGQTDKIGFSAPKDMVAFIYSMGENAISGQAVYSNAAYDTANPESNYPEQEPQYMGGGDDINNWDSGRSWERLYN